MSALKCMSDIFTFVSYRQQVSRVLHQAATSQRDHEPLTLLPGQSRWKTSRGAPSECLLPLKGKGGGRRPSETKVKNFAFIDSRLFFVISVFTISVLVEPRGIGTEINILLH